MIKIVDVAATNPLFASTVFFWYDERYQINAPSQATGYLTLAAVAVWIYRHVRPARFLRGSVSGGGRMLLRQMKYRGLRHIK